MWDFTKAMLRWKFIALIAETGKKLFKNNDLFLAQEAGRANYLNLYIEKKK